MITRIFTRGEANPGLSRDIRESVEAEEDVEPIDQAHIAWAIDRAAYLSLEYGGNYGSASCSPYLVTGWDTWRVDAHDGRQYFMRVDDDFEDIEEDEDAEDILSLIAALPAGELDSDDLDAVSGEVWDGNNHVRINAEHSVEFLTNNDDEENHEWGVAVYSWEHDGSKTLSETRVNDAWFEVGSVSHFSEHDDEIDDDAFRAFRDLKPGTRECELIVEFNNPTDDDCVIWFAKKTDRTQVLAWFRALIEYEDDDTD